MTVNEPAGQTATATQPPLAGPATGNGLGIVAVVLGGLGGLVPWIPADLTSDSRAYTTLALGLVGLLLGIVGRRNGNVVATVGSILCAIAVGLSAVMLIGAKHDKTPQNTGSGDHTPGVLRDDLDVRFDGDWYDDPDAGGKRMAITLYNKGPDRASFSVTIHQKLEGRDGKPCDPSVTAYDLAPGASYQAQISSCYQPKYLSALSMQVTKADKF